MQAEKSLLLVNIFGFSVGIQGVSRLITFKERAFIINKQIRKFHYPHKILE